jgi:hypothetical protein
MFEVALSHRQKNVPQVCSTFKKGRAAYVDHDSLFAHLLQSERCTDCTPVKFNGAANAVHTAAENDDSVVVETDIMSSCIVGRILR